MSILRTLPARLAPLLVALLLIPSQALAGQSPCKTGDACMSAAAALVKKHPSPTNAIVEQALALYERACSLGSGLACREAGMLIRARDPNLARMRSAFGMGCTLEDGLSCSELGLVLVGTEPKEARKLFGAACTLGHALGCSNYGVVLRDGLGGRKHARAAEKAFAKACGLASGEACGMQASMLEQRSKGKARAKVTALYLKGCGLGSGSSCGAAGTRYATGVGARKDVVRARKLLERSCQLKDGRGCYNLGVALGSGVLGSANPSAASQALAASCALDYAPGCAQLAELLAAGKVDSAAVGRQTPATLRQKACRLGFKPACGGS